VPRDNLVPGLQARHLVSGILPESMRQHCITAYGTKQFLRSHASNPACCALDEQIRHRNSFPRIQPTYASFSILSAHLTSGRSGVLRLFSLVRVPQPKTLPEVLSREEVARLLGSVREPRYRMLFELIYGCRLQINEVAKLGFRDIKRSDHRLHIRQHLLKYPK